MKTTPLILSFCCFQFSAGLCDLTADELPKATEAERVATAEALVDALAREDFAAATARFSPTLRRTLPEARLRDMWASMMRQAGAFRSRSGSRTEGSGGHQIVYVLTEFREFVLEAKVVFNAEGEITGFHFLAPPSAGVVPAAGDPEVARMC